VLSRKALLDVEKSRGVDHSNTCHRVCSRKGQGTMQDPKMTISMELRGHAAGWIDFIFFVT